MNDAKMLDEWIPRHLVNYGNVLLPSKFVKRWGKENMRLVLQTITGMDIEIVEEISYMPTRLGRMKKQVDYIARQRKVIRDGKQSPDFWKNY